MTLLPSLLPKFYPHQKRVLIIESHDKVYAAVSCLVSDLYSTYHDPRTDPYVEYSNQDIELVCLRSPDVATVDEALEKLLHMTVELLMKPRHLLVVEAGERGRKCRTTEHGVYFTQ